ncbi:hypothetical protein BpHYR1_018169 [Brachionus plicatilis]|uniref:Uncharacterized protein n=1 Tax=Brachionus plicatilis TaxID=10195 RepID=A0A3M7SHC7_BRAPC|nr:hypothetical protein BpHYR1_018169 [Brachionus plicatilis]
MFKTFSFFSSLSSVELPTKLFMLSQMECSFSCSFSSSKFSLILSAFLDTFTLITLASKLSMTILITGVRFVSESVFSWLTISHMVSGLLRPSSFLASEYSWLKLVIGACYGSKGNHETISH